VSVLARVVGGVPVDPDAATARRWAVEELLDPVYHQQRSLLDRLVAWLTEVLSGLRTPAVFDPVAIVVVVLVVAAVVGLAFLVAGPVRLARSGRTDRSVLAEDDARTSDEMRTAADAAAAAGDWATAVVERFRAIVRGLEERAVLDERAARTAHEAALAAAARLPALGSELVAAGRTFDDVAYGDEPATELDEVRLRGLDARVRDARATPVSQVGDLTVAAPR
jgi:hypothetical protein